MGKRTGIVALAGAVLLLAMFLILGAIAGDAATEKTPDAEPETEPACIIYEPEELEPGEYIIQGPVYIITDDERELIEKVVAAEARGESIECMMAVAQVIRDRCITREQSVTEVLTAPNQFSAPYDGKVADRIKDAVAFTFNEGHSTFEYPATHFYASHLIEAPDWTESMEYLGEIDGVSFYRQ
ncbi:putative Cell wall hydrolase [Firmicutes bacterium CAG:238]|nr:putative Cell wall hydrolase [Firmicutes bacterium CAG:238]